MKINNKKIWLAVDVFLIVLSLALAFIAYRLVISYGNIEKIISQSENKISGIKNGSEENFLVRRNLDGVMVPAGEENLLPAAIIIENHTDSRPPAALSKANLVYEAEAEGAITRFLAVFADVADIEKIGPVRSARPYFVDWAKELSALFIHAGGSPEALAKIIKDNISDMNEFYQGDYFWRDPKRSAPHNVYISGENIEKYTEKKGIKEGNFIPWKFKDDSPLVKPDSLKISIVNPDYNYSVEWRYDPQNNNYIRNMAGKPHQDEDESEIRAKNVVIATVRAQVMDEELRLKMDDVGEDKAIICLDGACRSGVWKKDNSYSRIRFYYDGGEEVEFNAGATWVEAVRPEREVVYHATL